MHEMPKDVLRPTDELPVEPDAQPDEPAVPAEATDHVLADWKAAEPDAFRPAGVELTDDEVPLDREDDIRRGL